MPPAYLAFEDFAHSPLGLETYADGLQHPVELRRILTGDLAIEMSVSYKGSVEAGFQDLAYPRQVRKGLEIFDSSGRSVFRSSGGGGHHHKTWPEVQDPSGSQDPGHQLLVLMAQAQAAQVAALEQAQDATTLRLLPPPPPRSKPGRPPISHGEFDPDTGQVRYICRLHCGASLASAKGRRKHEKKHCPNFGKYAQPKGRGRGRGSRSPYIIGERKTYDCRICGKVLRTYEGRRLHEKIQHIAKMKRAAEEAEARQLDEDASDSKQLLIEHLKAAGMDPEIIDKTLNEDDGDEEDKDFSDVMRDVNNESFEEMDEEDEEEEEEDEEVQPSSSSGIEEHFGENVS